MLPRINLVDRRHLRFLFWESGAYFREPFVGIRLFDAVKRITVAGKQMRTLRVQHHGGAFK